MAKFTPHKPIAKCSDEELRALLDETSGEFRKLILMEMGKRVAEQMSTPRRNPSKSRTTAKYPYVFGYRQLGTGYQGYARLGLKSAEITSARMDDPRDAAAWVEMLLRERGVFKMVWSGEHVSETKMTQYGWETELRQGLGMSDLTAAGMRGHDTSPWGADASRQRGRRNPSGASLYRMVDRGSGSWDLMDGDSVLVRGGSYTEVSNLKHILEHQEAGVTEAHEVADAVRASRQRSRQNPSRASRALEKPFWWLITGNRIEKTASAMSFDTHSEMVAHYTAEHQLAAYKKRGGFMLTSKKKVSKKTFLDGFRSAYPEIRLEV